jgi:serine/threonine-protein kinase
MFAGELPEWPYEWPLPGNSRLRRRLPGSFIAFLRKSIDVRPRKRYRDANKMLEAFHQVKDRALTNSAARRRRSPR